MMADGWWLMVDAAMWVALRHLTSSIFHHPSHLPLIHKPFRTILWKNNDNHVSNNTERDSEPDADGTVG